MLERVGWLAIALVLSSSFGCQLNRRARWHPPSMASPVKKVRGKSVAARIESLYSRAVRREQKRDARCIDDYFQAATLAWPDVEQQALQKGAPSGRSSEIYHSCLVKLVTTGAHFGRFDPKRGLDIKTPEGLITIPNHYHGYVRQPSDFDQVFPVGDYRAKDLYETFRYDGLGQPAVVVHHRRPGEKFRRRQQTFSATIVLRSRGDLNPEGFSLEFYDPHRRKEIAAPDGVIPLKRDLSAAAAFILSRAGRQYLAGFLQPGTRTGDEGLFMVEPYQPGKIPVVFVHGLLSDPYTWANIANELYARDDIVERFQLWAYEYPTGEPFLTSAAGLRRQLQEVKQCFDPGDTDDALDRVTLIGHSMGGLVSKLQVTRSENRLWDSVSARPFQNIVATPQARRLLAEAFFFEPSPMVTRVVYVGTPHRGSPWARRPIGEIAAKLVKEPEENEALHAQLVRENPGVFTREFSERIPASIDMLESTSPLLAAIDQLPRSGGVRFHSIIGEGYWLAGAGSSDKVVPVTSARQYGVETEKMIRAKHGELHQNPEGIEEILCILRQHVKEYDAELIHEHIHSLGRPSTSGIFQQRPMLAPGQRSFMTPRTVRRKPKIKVEPVRQPEPT